MFNAHSTPLQQTTTEEPRSTRPLWANVQRLRGLALWARTHWAGLTLSLILLAGAVLRLYILFKSHGIGDGDEALTGVMALDIQKGEFPAFTYGQPYMAATEAYFTAMVYYLTGFHSWGMKVLPFLVSLGLIWLNYLLGRRFLDSKQAGLFAAALTAVPSLYFAVLGLRAYNHSTETMFGGQLLILVAGAILWGKPKDEANQKAWKWGYTRREWLLWLALGLVAGVNFYGHGLSLFFFVPVIFFLFLKDKLFFVRPTAAATILGFLVGSFPWWLYNLLTNWHTLGYYFKPADPNKKPALDVLGHFFGYSWPLSTGAFNYWFVTPVVIGIFLNVVFSLAIIGWVVARWRGLVGWFWLSFGPSKPVVLLLLTALLMPLLYLLWGFGNVAFTDLDTTGRYLLPLMSILPVLVGGGLAKFFESFPGKIPALHNWKETRQKGVYYGLGIILLVAILGGNLWLYRGVDYPSVFQSPYFPQIRPPLDNGPLINYLKSQGIEYATCNHWVGNRIILDSAEAVKCVDYHDLSVGGLDRFEKYSQAIKQPGLRVAFVLLNLDDGAVPMEKRLQQLGVTYTRHDFLPYIVIIPTSRPVSPDEVIEQLHYPL